MLYPYSVNKQITSAELLRICPSWCFISAQSMKLTSFLMDIIVKWTKLPRRNFTYKDFHTTSLTTGLFERNSSTWPQNKYVIPWHSLCQHHHHPRRSALAQNSILLPAWVCLKFLTFPVALSAIPHFWSILRWNDQPFWGQCSFLLIDCSENT